eukprot:2543843-Rhodomonas_salina.1
MLYGTDICYAATRMCGTDIAYAATRLCALLQHGAHVKRPCCRYRPTHAYAMSGIYIAYVAIGLRSRYAMSGVDIAYVAIGLCSVPGIDIAYVAIGLRAHYAISGIDIAYGATRDISSGVPLDTR